MADRAVVDRVFNAIIEQTSEEVGALLGADVTLENHQTRLLSKEQIFEIKRGRSVLTTMEISGDQDGKAFLITDQKDSITLGGTLIMLPPDQIEENCKQHSFEGEAADAFGEVTNIIAGVYTSIFLDMYPENLHFKRTDVNEFLPSRLDPASNLPFPPGEYFYSSCSIKLENESMGMLEAIIPAQILELASEARSAEEVPPEHGQKIPDKGTVAESKGEEPQLEAPDKKTAVQEYTSTDEVTPGAGEESAEPQEDEQPPAEKKYVELSVADRVLKASLEQCAEEIGAMLGLEVELSSLNTAYISKAEYFSKPGPKSTVTEMLVNGDQDGVSYFIVDLKDSIFFGGTLVMLPENELESRMRSGELDGEIEDAFGEVANIISGGIVQNFDEMFPRKFHVKKGNVEAFTPTKVIVEDPKPFPDGEYYSVSASMDCDTHDLGHLTYLIPVELLHIPPRPVQSGWGDTTAAEESPQPQQRTEKAVEQEEEKSQEIPAKKEKSPAQSGVSATVTQEQVKEPVVAVVYKDSSMAEAYIEALRECGHTPVALAANQSFNSLRQNQVCGALLIIDRVDDDAFALMIKIRSETPAQQPLIVAGPDWTRSAVLKAVKYGVTDIIPTPATAAEIREKVEHNLKNSC